MPRTHLKGIIAVEYPIRALKECCTIGITALVAIPTAVLFMAASSVSCIAWIVGLRISAHQDMVVATTDVSTRLNIMNTMPSLKATPAAHTAQLLKLPQPSQLRTAAGLALKCT